MAPTPIPLSTWPGSHSVRKAGWSPTSWTYQRYAAAHTSAPGTTTSRKPRRCANGPSNAATTAATTAAGTRARPEVMTS